MSESKHDLVSEFPNYKDRIHSLKTEDAHFRKLFDDYHDVTRAISRSEQRLDLLNELEEETLRKKRLLLKDQLFSIISGSKPGS